MPAHDDPTAAVPDADDDGLDNLLEYLRAARGFDFTEYKRPSLLRRVGRRVQETRCASIADYQDHLEVHPEEFPVLLDTLLIKVTEFFRDPDAWAYLADSVLPQILAEGPADRPLRVWSAGCATGEEAYTIAILLVEALGETGFKERVKIYATDIDEEALATARAGTYPAGALDHLDPTLRRHYFEEDGDKYTFRQDLRRSLIFGRHDLTADAPISRLDLLVSRNTIMYFNAELQSRVTARLHYALRDHGFLFLGRAETMLAHQDLFEPVDPHFRVFAKVPTRTRLATRIADQVLSGLPVGVGAPPIIERAASVVPVAQFVVDIDGFLVAANAMARGQFGVSAADIGRPFHDLPVSYRPAELRSLIESAYATSAPFTRTGVGRELDDGRSQYFDITIVPLGDEDGAPIGVSIAFTDTTETVRLRNDLARSGEELQTANEELQSANEELQTSNEELQSTNEELETSNEELQSANEELETTNEELHSSNQELAAMNDELQIRSLALDRAAGLLESIISSLSAGVIVVDSQLDIEVWNRAAQNLFGVTHDEVVGRSFSALDIGLPVAELVQPLREAIAGDKRELRIAAVDRRGRPVTCSVRLSPLIVEHKLHGAVLLIAADEEP